MERSDAPLLGGRYNVVRFLGKGGFGIVEACTDNHQNNAYVAIKTIPSKCVNRESKRLLREVDIMIQLANKHPHLMSVLDVFVTPAATRAGSTGGDEEDEEQGYTDGVINQTSISMAAGENNQSAATSTAPAVTAESDFNVHMVMPMMKGDLHQFSRHLQRMKAVDGSFSATVSVVFAFQIAFGLDYLHQCGIVHRDLKPDNVLIRLDLVNPYASTAVIADFGLARDVATSDTFYICTRHYRPPEVVTNISKGETTIDIWSLGCILYELVTGKTLFCLPTALNAQGQWEGGKASQQLEVILGIVGLPPRDMVEKYIPAGNVRSYLMNSRPRPSRLEALIRTNWHLDGAPEEEIVLWIDLITKCLDFFHERRPTAQQLCTHPLFKRYDVHYGENVAQYPVHMYQAVSVSESSGAHAMQENKDSVLTAVQHLHESLAQYEDEFDASHGDESGQPAPEVAAQVEESQPQQQQNFAQGQKVLRSAHHFPTIHNETLRNKYTNFPVRTAAEIEEGISEVLQDLELFTHDVTTSTELRLLLTYFMGLNQGGAVGVPNEDIVDAPVVAGAGGGLIRDDTDVIPEDAAAPVPIEDDDDDDDW